ncbi:MAG TPA: glycosyltransferase family 87 protein [Blastocatellia bacterium]|nr:glycosyltransferase family 87 protein [Blastocatellia bacterium]
MKKNRRIVLLISVVLLIALLGLAFTSNLIDFPVYYAAGRSLLSGRTDLYSPDFALGRVMDYRYPPFFLLAMLPLCFLPYSIAAYVWYLLLAAAAVGCVIIAGRAFSMPRRPFAAWAAVALSVVQYFVMALHYGNAHLLVVFLLFASMYLVLRQRDALAAAPLALGISIKLTPALLLPYFVLRKRWTLLLAVCLFVIAINVIPSLYFGFSRNNELLGTWCKHVVASQEFHEQNGPINLSLKGQLRRYFSEIDYSQRVDGDIRYPTFNIASFSYERIDQGWIVIATLLFAAGLWLIYDVSRGSLLIKDQHRSPTMARAVSLEIGLMICLTLLVGPLTSKIYFIALLWPVACLASFAAGDDGPAGRFAGRILVAVAVANSVLPLLPGRLVQRWLLVLGVDFYVNCLLMIALGYALVVQARAFRTRFGEQQTPAPSEARMP